MDTAASPAPNTSQLELDADSLFRPLKQAELKLLHAAPQGQLACCSLSKDENDSLNDTACSDHWLPEREIRAELIEWLCRSEHASKIRSIRIFGARIHGILNLSHICINFPICFQKCRVLDHIDLKGSEFPALDLEGSWIKSLNADCAKTKLDILLRNQFRANGLVSLYGTRIGRNLDCSGGTFENPGTSDVDWSWMAINATRINVGGAVLLRSGFYANGEVWLLGAEIGGSLECTNAQFVAETRHSPDQPECTDGTVDRTKHSHGPGQLGKGSVGLLADSAKIKGHVKLSGRFCADIGVYLYQAEIGGALNCSGAQFTIPSCLRNTNEWTALNAESANVMGNVILIDHFSAQGHVCLKNAQIAGALIVKNTEIHELDLTGSSVDSIEDDDPDWPQNWPCKGKLHLDGFVYNHISGGPRDAKTRLKWISLQGENFHPQPYRQLSSVLRNIGDEKGRKEICIALQQKIWKKRNIMFRLLSPVVHWTIGYGYASLRALGCLLLLVAVGLPIYRIGYLSGSLTPVQKEAFAEFEKSCSAPRYYEHFQALVYSVENSFPVIKLGVQDKWIPSTEARISSCVGASKDLPLIPSNISPGVVRGFRLGQICLGWILTTLFVAGITGIIRKD